MSGTIIGIANAFGSSLTPGTVGQGQAPAPTPGSGPMTFFVTPYNSGGTSTPSGQYQLGLYSTGTYNFTVSWGDGSSDDVITSYNQPEATHDYGVVTPADRFLITITANTAFASSSFDHWFFGNRTQGDGVKVTSINLYGGVRFYANEDVFYGCEGLTTVNTSINNIPTFVNKDIIDSFFFKCTNLSVSFTLSYWVGPFTGTAIDFNGGTEAGGIPTGSSNGYFDFDFAPTSLLRAFENQASFNNQSLNNWDVSGSNDFSSAFEGCLRFNRPLPWTFQTGSPILATDMFKNAVDFNQDITAWDTSAFTHMDGMFARTLSIGGPVLASSFNQPIGLWNTNSVQDASAMFFNAEVFNRDLTNWFSTGSLVNTSFTSGGIVSMFSGASNFNGQVLNWNTSNLTGFGFVFNGASAFNQDLSRWDTSSGQVFVSTFNGATSFNQDLSSWDVSMGLFFDEMFKGATSFLGTGIDSWNTASASSFSSMFNGASAFNQNLYSWDISNLTNASDMLTGTAISNDNWDSLLIGWGYAQQANLNNNVTLSDVPAQHGPGFVNAIFDKLTDSVANGGYGWTILDQGQSALPPPPLEFTIDTTATETGSSANDQYRLPLMSTGTYNFYVDWGDGTIGDQITSWNQAEATHTYATAGTYIVQILATARVGQTPSVDHISWASQNGTTLTAANDRLKVQGIAKWGSAQVYLNEYVFTRCSNLDITTTALPNFGSKVLRTSAFENCDSLSGNLSGWGTVSSPITGFGSLFYKDAASSNPNFNFVFQVTAGSLTQAFNNSTDFNNPLDNWDVSNASGFTQTFSSATSFNQDISGWDTGNSGAFNGMFIDASSFNQNISSWNVANATTFSQTFKNATSFNQPIGAWTTTSLTNLFETFSGATAFDQNLANWDVSGVTTATSMLTNSGISAANWDALLIGWAAQGTGAGSLQANVTLSNINQLHGSVDSAATAAYNKLTASPYNWTIVDLGGVPVGNLLLDTSYGSGAEAAYSVRKLRTAYTGPAIKVQDTVGGATQDIYFDANNNLDEAAIVSYGGSNDVFVETWYDQSINGNDATQGTSSARPKIYDGTTGALVTENGKPAIYFDGFTHVINAMSLVSQPITIFDVLAIQSYGAVNYMFDSDSTNANRIFIGSNTSDNWRYFAGTTRNSATSAALSQTLLTGLFDGSGSELFANATSIDAGDVGSNGISELYIGTKNDGTIGIRGNCQELILYASDKSGADQTSIEENIGDYFTQNTPLLDTYTGAAAAYSLRLLDSTYTGSAVQVQDTVGGATQDIGFNVFGELDTVALAAYGGSNDVFVVTWYDQSGNSNDATQVTSANRPKIYDGATASVVTENGKPAVSFDGVDDFMLSALQFTNTDKTIQIVYTPQESASYAFGILNINTITRARFYLQTGSATANFTEGNPSVVNSVSSSQTQQIFYMDWRNSNYQFNFAVDGNTVQNATGNANTPVGVKYMLGAINNGADAPFGSALGKYQEVIIYDSDESANRTGIETNINTFYDIYTEPVAPLLLNNYPGAAAAYSLRRINSSYQGSAVLVQTALNTKGPVYIGFDSNNDLDTTSLATYGGSEDVVVAGWLDQSGNGNDASQATSANRPKIYDGTTGVVTENGKAALDFKAGDFMSDTSWNGASTTYIFNVLKSNGSESSPRIGVDVGSSVEYYGLGIDGNGGASSAGITGLSQFSNGTAIGATRNAMWDAMQSQNVLTVSGDFSSWTGGFGLTRSGQKMYTFAQEFVIYNADKSSDRTDIEDNIGGYYDIPLAGLLDENPGAAAAYSLRRLSSTYTGSAIQVQRADNVGGTTDIGFDGYGNLDTAALTTAAAGNDMVVATWYDQSGSGNDATQGTSTARPKIYTGGAIVNNPSSGKPALLWNENQRLINTSLAASGSMSAFTTARISTKFRDGVIDSYESTSRAYVRIDSTFFYFKDGGSASTAIDTHYLLSSFQVAGTSKAGFVNGNSDLSNSNSDAAFDGLSIGSIAGNPNPLSTSFNFGGYIDEIVIYNTDKSTDRTDIEDNIGGYYDIPLAGLLDENPGAAAAYSLRRLSSTYTGSAIQVQRADNVGGTTDIGFDSYGELDTTALTTAAAGNDMVVATWYDQSGNSNDVTQVTSANRPKIYDGTTGVVTENGKPAIQFDGSNDNLAASSAVITGDELFVANVLTMGTTGQPWGDKGAGSDGVRAYQAGSTTLRVQYVTDNGGFQLTGDSSGSGQRLKISRLISGTQEVFDNGTLATSRTDTFTSLASNNVLLFGMRSNNSTFFDGKLQEYIIYNTDQSSNRTGIETNINTFYNIY